ncbi:hypothetical protein MK851_15520 [Tenacibaculum sp. 1B UA]|uniref:competence protein CoiA family protein n=1 Tax=unclassified Tenacibaculum TaxID=2635139 RepID=UPI0026E20DE6|nr:MULTISPECIES: competence protein CoiA family protein [unclassified Tenacibaculum]MDO6676916.1 competence protein CoiA family protein [Tenacibaculum sp. 1_MG-2023]MDX8555019.1 hypothetical protein [Tenacibaculum sp. 1B UA]
MKKILHTVAINKSGDLITAKNAKKGSDFFCPLCKNELILRKSGKTGKGSKRPHFAHRILTPNCTPESALHFNFKNLLVEKIKQKIEKEEPLSISWNCKHCYDFHSGNLLKKIKSVKVEHNMTLCQPDIALFDFENKVFAVIEVVVTHKPEEKVLNFYLENNIILIQINLTSEEDIENWKEKISKPDIVEICFNPKCKTCGNFQHKTKMTIVEGPCWKCHSSMKVAVIEGGMERGGSSCGADEFSKEEIEFAKRKGTIIKSHYSKTMHERYLASTCNKCGAFAGNFYLFTDYLQPASIGELPSETFDIGYYCNNCFEIEEDDYMNF